MRKGPRRRAHSLLVAGLVLLSLLAPMIPASAAPLFSDGFEAGNLSAWTSTVGGVSVVQNAGFAFAGSWYGQAISTGPSAYATKTLPSAQPDIYVKAAFNVVSPPGGTTGLTLIRLTTAASAAIVSLKIDKSLHLNVKNHVSGGSVTSATILPAAAWHTLQLHAHVNGAGSLVEVWLDGNAVTDLTSSASLGTTAVGALQLGNLGTTLGFTLAFDEVVADTLFIGGGPPPATPANLHTTSVTSSQVSLAWDPVAGAEGYGVYRNGIKQGPDIASTSFNDTTVQPSTQYTYTVDAFVGTSRSAQTPGLVVMTAGPAGPIVVMAAGDIACDPADPNFNNGNGAPGQCQQMATSNLLTGANDVLAVGDTVYDCGGPVAYQQSYTPSWGRFNSITWATVGDNEYNTPTQAPNGTGCTTLLDAAGYYNYFGNRGGSVSVPPLPGVSQSAVPSLFSFNLPDGCVPGAGGTCTWHVVALNSNCALLTGGCGLGSPTDVWLKQDLAANAWAGCTLAFEHHPRFTSKAPLGFTNAKLKQMWKDFVSGGVDVVLSGHSHFYERFTRQGAKGNAMANGAAEFIVGTGGRNQGAIAPPGMRLPNSQAGQSGTFGVLKLTLNAGSYGWDFLPIPGGTFIDTGSLACT